MSKDRLILLSEENFDVLIGSGWVVVDGVRIVLVEKGVSFNIERIANIVQAAVLKAALKKKKRQGEQVR